MTTHFYLNGIKEIINSHIHTSSNRERAVPAAKNEQTSEVIMVATSSSRERVSTGTKNDQTSEVIMVATSSSRERVSMGTKNDQTSEVNMVKNPSVCEGAVIAAKNELTKFYKQNNYAKCQTCKNYKKYATVDFTARVNNGNFRIICIVSIMLYLCYAKEVQTNNVRNIVNKVYNLKSQMICCMSIYYQLYKFCMVLLFNISFFNILHVGILTCIFSLAFVFKVMEGYYVTYMNVSFDECFSEPMELSIKTTEQNTLFIPMKGCRSRHGKFVS